MLKFFEYLAAFLLALGFIFAPYVNGEQLPAPMEKDILPGVTHVLYMGQDLRFETSVAMHVSLVAKGPTLIQLKFKCRPTTSGGPSRASSKDGITIRWENWGNDIYEGPPPTGEWEGVLDTESGFTEK